MFYKIIPPVGSGKLRPFLRAATLLLFLTHTFLCLHANQPQKGLKFTLNLKSATLLEVFRHIEEKSSYRVMYLDDLLKESKRISIDVKEVELETLLKAAFQNQPLYYQIKDSTIVVNLRKDINQPSKTPPITADRDTLIDVSGRVVSAKDGTPLPGATVKTSTGGVNTDAEGRFKITAPINSILTVSFIGFSPKTAKLPLQSGSTLLVSLEENEQALKAVEVVSTGYQTLPKERATGSFEFIDNKTLNRAVSVDVLSRLKGMANGFLMDNSTGNPLGISVRGRSTLFSNTQPLLVVDNFPYEGELSNINPNDIESITILKDGAAASIWGTRAGNGVIVITTKRGSINMKPQVGFTTNFTVTDRPDLNYQERISSADFLEVEEYLFGRGYYNPIINNGYALISPAVQTFYDRRRGLISAKDSADIIDGLKQKDVMNDYGKYFYRRAVNQQYQVNVKGGGTGHGYYVSIGYDKNLSENKGKGYDRYTLRANNNISLLKDKLQITSDVTFSTSNNINDYYQGYTPKYPYESLVDASGAALPVSKSGGLRSDYIDTAGQGYLLDWKYRPVDELQKKHSKSNGKVSNYMISLQSSYEILKGLKLGFSYQFNSFVTNTTTYNDALSYYTRDRINSLSQIDFNSGIVNRPIQLGGIKSELFNNYTANFGRVQLQYEKSLGNHQINGVAGYELRKESGLLITPTTVYGYNPENESFQLINHEKQYPYYYGFAITPILNDALRIATNDRNVSYYANLGYSFKNKYLFSASFRKDESNLVGVKTNQRGVPLWSVGAAWNIHSEESYPITQLPLFKFRMTYGYSGNVDKNTTALLTAKPQGNTLFLDPFYEVVNPPNPSLRWERVKNFNVGIDFVYGKYDRFSGSIEYYIKNGEDLMGNSPIAPQTGLEIFYGNVANSSTKGIDFKFTSKNIRKKDFFWISTLIFNINKDKVTNYKARPGVNSDITNSSSRKITPFEDYPIYTVISYKYAGLDELGDPLGYLDGKISKNYNSMRQSTDLDNLVFHGSRTPTVFGSLINTFSYQNLELSFNILYKFGNHFRRKSFMSNGLIGAGTWIMSDYGERWKETGDETRTSVPSFVYPINTNRDTFYESTEGLIENGDCIRLNDIRINYNLPKKHSSFLSDANIYIYASNLVILWRANRSGLDPEVISGYPTPKSIAMGINLKF